MQFMGEISRYKDFDGAVSFDVRDWPVFRRVMSARGLLVLAEQNYYPYRNLLN